MIAALLEQIALVIAVKKGWQLTRMIHKELKDRSAHQSVRSMAPRICAKLERARMKKLISTHDYSIWRRELLFAEKDHDCRSQTASSHA